MDNSFSKADAGIVQRCHRRTNMVTIAIVMVVFLSFSGSTLETLMPISEKEIHIRRDVYGEHNPTVRRLPYEIKIPFIDETRTPFFEIFFAIQLGGVVVSAMLASLSISLVPVTMIYIRSQYSILSKYIRLVGEEHRDELGYRIYYTDIERNQYNFKLYSQSSKHLE
ncbi:hypothetical protein WDU94_006189 [Cyamophila willieti]